MADVSLHKKPSPRVTVLMPVFNGAEYLQEAIESILRQSFGDFEFLIVDDGSSDESAAVAERCADPRIRLVRNGTNRGLVASLNLGLDLARGDYVARMDADDISMRDRLQRQVDFMEGHPDVAVCGSWLEAFEGRKGTLWPPPLEDAEIKCGLLFESVIYHPTVMLRKSALLEGAVRYDSAFPHAEDYELWERMARSCRLANLGVVLLRYRLHGRSVGRREGEAQALSAGRVRERFLARLGIEPTSAELELHQAISSWRIDADPVFLQQAHAWLLKLMEANRVGGALPQQELELMLGKRWYDICRVALPIGSEAYRLCFRSPLSRYWTASWWERLSFRVRAFLRGGGSSSHAQ